MAAQVDGVAALALLSDPLRRRIYDLATAGEVSRDSAAEALDISRSVAGFHLDKLVDAGFLVVEHRRPPGRTGPGAGRPAKWYRRGPGEVSVSVPDRRYELAAQLLAGAFERASGGPQPTARALHEVAREHGRQLGDAVRAAAGGRVPTIGAVVEVLARHGYEPHRRGRTVTLGNCPFGALAAAHRQLVCGMNLDLLDGLADAAGLPPGTARLDPAPGCCCVTLLP